MPGRLGWYMELEAVKKQVDFEAKSYKRMEDDEWKRKRIKLYMGSYKKSYPKEYSQFISEKTGWEGALDKIKDEVDWYADAQKLTKEQKLERFLLCIEVLKGDYPKEYAEYISAGNFSDI